MMEDNTLYTIIVHSENISGILNQVAAVFTRLQVNIESLNVSASSMKNVHKFTITCKTTARNIDKILKQINKKMDVINASCYTDDEIFQSEIAMFKLSTDEFKNSEDTSRLLRGYNTHIVEVTPEFLVVELAGSGEAIDSLYGELDRIKPALLDAVRVLKKGGMLGVITFHSLEDRIAKWTLKERSSEVDDIEILTKKPIVPSKEEEDENPPSRSAKLRIARKIK